MPALSPFITTFSAPPQEFAGLTRNRQDPGPSYGQFPGCVPAIPMRPDQYAILGYFLAKTIGNPAAGRIVGRKLDLHPIARQDANKVDAHLARNVCQHLMTGRQFHAKHCIREDLDDGPLYFDHVFLGHRLLHAPAAVIAARMASSLTGSPAASFSASAGDTGSPTARCLTFFRLGRATVRVRPSASRAVMGPSAATTTYRLP